MNNQYQWLQPFNNQFGDGMVYRQFAIGSTLYAVGFEEIETMGDLTRKGIDILRVDPAFRFPNNGVWGVIFDEVDPSSMDFKGFQHIQHPGVMGGRTLYNVTSTILEHYTVCNAGAYVFSAAPDLSQLRGTDLVDIYSRALGINGHEKSKLFSMLFEGWQAFSDVVTGGRGYVVTTESY
ncbi:hypothetical protein [Yersinia aldovae]|uniref:hypothetical protein n=1 Tax=Yersinia aldovae TaxID=29483 RepID=UPI0005AC0839|nr:hypothetical protein [Yersinia aldovae]AJJ63278.1 hypothetical protein AT01_164 [Yersinia aldovae 670-83]